MTTFRGENLSLRRVGDTLEVELHSDPCNAIGTTTLSELERVAEVLEADEHGARALIWTSTCRKGFCEGADLEELLLGLKDRRAGSLGRARRVSALLPEGAKALAKRGVRKFADPLIRLEIRRFIDRIHRVFDTFDTAPITTVAATHGVVFGGGFELALTADIIVADKSTRFCFPELRLGIVPAFGGIPRLERDLGNAMVRDLLLTGRSVNATRAHSVGLVSQVVGRGQALAVARKVAEQAARFEPETTRAAKAFLKPLPRQRLEQEKQLFTQMVTSPAVQRALAAFVDSEDVRPYLPSDKDGSP